MAPAFRSAPYIGLAHFAAVITVAFPLRAAAEAAAETPAYYSIVATEQQFSEISVYDGYNPEHALITKYTAPASDDPDLVPTHYINVQRYINHIAFLWEVFPEQFGSMTFDDYVAIMGMRETRLYFTGVIYQYPDRRGSYYYGFDFYMDPEDPTGPLRADEALSLYNRIAETFLLRPLFYMPHRDFDIDNAHRWGDDLPFPVTFPGVSPPAQFAAYTPGTNYGRVRLLTSSEFDAASSSGDLSWQDILVLESVPFDIPAVIAGLFTAKPQSELSHVAIRMGLRQTPNAYLQNAPEILAPHDGQLVRIDIAADGCAVTPGVELAEAEAWWAEHRPKLEGVRAPDFDHTSIDAVDAMDLTPEPIPPVLRYGGKASNLATMYRFLPARYQVPAFAIPFHYYRDFMTANLITDSSVSPPRNMSYQEYIESLLANERFRTDGQYRASRLNAFREYAKKTAVVDPALVSALASKIDGVFGGTDIPVRFRSSSNIEDSLEFNGAGLYESTTVCVDDTFDGDDDGPSLCNPAEPDERTIQRALIKVWTSLWRPQAFEEREYYQVPQELAAMAILVSLAFPDEASNGVAFTGDPVLGPSAGFAINVMPGDVSVVSPNPGQLPEKDIIHVANGRIVRIVRSHPSSLMPPGQWVLSTDQLTSLGLVLDSIRDRYPVNPQGHDPDDVLLDLEFKFTHSGDLFIKQIRPFLVAGDGATTPLLSHDLTIHPGTFLHGRPLNPSPATIREDMALLSRIEFTSATLTFPMDHITTGIPLIRELRIGPNETLARAVAPSRTVPTRSEYYDTLKYSQSFETDDARIDLTLDMHLNPKTPAFTVSPSFLRAIACRGLVTFDDATTRAIAFAATDIETFPEWQYRLTLADGRAIGLRSHYVFWGLSNGPADLVAAHIVSPEGTRSQTSYFRLFLYADTVRLDQVTFTLLYDEPDGDAIGLSIREEAGAPYRYRVCELGEDYQCLRTLPVSHVERFPVFEPARGFLIW